MSNTMYISFSLLHWKLDLTFNKFVVQLWLALQGGASVGISASGPDWDTSSITPASQRQTENAGSAPEK